MICALAVRTLKPGTFEQFRQDFMRFEKHEDPPAGYVRFCMVRSAKNPDEVICFGLFDGTVDELRRTAEETDYAGQLEAIKNYCLSDVAQTTFLLLRFRLLQGALPRERYRAVAGDLLERCAADARLAPFVEKVDRARLLLA